MRKHILALLLLLNFVAFAQQPRVDKIRFKPTTTAEMNALVVPAGEYWVVYNSDDNEYKEWNGTAWMPRKLTVTEVEAIISNQLKYAQLTGGNLFTGNQDITGNLDVSGTSAFGENLTISKATNGNIGFIVENNLRSYFLGTSGANNGELVLSDVTNSSVIFDYLNTNGFRINKNTNIVGTLTTTGIITGNGSGLTNVDAATLDGLDSIDFVRSTGSITQTVTGVKTFTSFFKVLSSTTEQADPSNTSSKVVAFFDSSSGADNGGIAIKSGDTNDDESAIYIMDYLGNQIFNVKATTGNLITKGTVNIGAYTVATLPTGEEGDIARVTDAASLTWRGVATGGGTANALVFFDGTNWIYH